MSEPIPESIPTSQDPKSHRPLKRRALTPVSAQATQIDVLFAQPDRDIIIPLSSTLKARKLAAPPEIVANVQGSSAGAGSGEFHVYKASRRREYERLKAMDDEVKQEEEAKSFEQEKAEKEKRDEEKTKKNREKREKAKARKGKKNGKDDKGVVKDHGESGKVKAKTAPRLGPAKIASGRSKDDDDDDPDAMNGSANRSGAITKPEEIGVVIHDDN